MLLCCFHQQSKQTAPPVGGKTLHPEQVYPTPKQGHRGHLALAGLLPTQELLRMDLSHCYKLGAKLCNQEYLKLHFHGLLRQLR